MVTDPQTHIQTHAARPPAANTQTGPITIHCAAASAQCKKAYQSHISVTLVTITGIVVCRCYELLNVKHTYSVQ